MSQTLEFNQNGRSAIIFVHNNYPLYNKDVQEMVDAGLRDPREIKIRLHKLGLIRLKCMEEKDGQNTTDTN